MNSSMRNILILSVGLLALLLVIAGCQNNTVEQVDKGVPAENASTVAVNTSAPVAKEDAAPVVKKTAPVLSEEEVVAAEESSETATEESAETNETSAAKKTVKEEDVTIVKITANGFEPAEVTINAGETVRWVNERSGRLYKAIVLGNRQCISTRSPTLVPNQTYEFTFNTPMRCTITDGIATRQMSTVIVQ